MAIHLDRSILLLAGAAMLALAALILLLRPGRGINRALAALVAARGASLLLPQVSSDPAWSWTALEVQPYFALAVVPLALYCMHVLARTPGPGARRGAGWIALAAVLVLDLAYFVDHALVQTLAAGTAEVGAMQAAAGIQYTAFGPLWLLAGAAVPALAYLGLRLAVQYRHLARTRPDDLQGRQARLLLFLSSGLMLGALFDGASRLSALVSLLDAPGPFPWLPWGWAVMALPVLALVPAALTVAVLVGGRAPRTPLWRTERFMVGLAGFAFFSGFLRLLFPSDSDVAGSPLVLLLLGAWRLAMPALVAYALLRYPLHAANAAPQAGSASVGVDPDPKSRPAQPTRPAPR
jgi:hypothetical protein